MGFCAYPVSVFVYTNAGLELFPATFARGYSHENWVFPRKRTNMQPGSACTWHVSLTYLHCSITANLYSWQYTSICCPALECIRERGSRLRERIHKNRRTAVQLTRKNAAANEAAVLLPRYTSFIRYTANSTANSTVIQLSLRKSTIPVLQPWWRCNSKCIVECCGAATAFVDATLRFVFVSAFRIRFIVLVLAFRIW